MKPLALVPLPASVRREAGELRLDRPLTIVGGGAEGKTLIESLTHDGVKVGPKGIRVLLRMVSGLPAEGYRLRVNPDGATLEATTSAGLFYAGQTLRQLIQGDSIPAVEIEDAPRFPWRGMLLDVSRHFRSKEEVERLIDLNAQQKLNVFHWHLTDDGGWRMETKGFPALTSRGAWRSYPPKGHWDYSGINFPEQRKGDEYGGFYSRKDIKEVLAFAAKRHVTVVPEIEMPGHSQAALQVFPQYGHDNLPAGQKSYSFCPGKEETFKFLYKVLDDTMAQFPSKFIHIGGDEVEKSQWDRCPACQARMKSEGLKTADELQSYFIRRIDQYLASKGRRLIGWDEILEGGLAPGAAVMSWRGIQGGIAAAQQGKDVVMSPTSHLYLDYSYDAIPTELVYAYEPIPAELTPEQAKHVLGAQGNVWTEWLPDMTDIERMAYPRAAALAEVTWSPKEQRSWPDFSMRLNGLLARLDAQKVAYRIDPPAVPQNAYLTDENVYFVPPIARAGWSLIANGAVVSLPMTLQPGTDLRMSFVRQSDGAKSPEVRVQVNRGERRASADGLTSGLSLESAAGKFAKVDAFAPTQTTIVSTIDLANKPAAEGFALRFTGYIQLPADGSYTFGVRSDDGAVLKIGGLTVVDHDGEHAATVKNGTVWAKAGVYPIELGYFDAGGASALSVTVTPPGGSAMAIPSDWLKH